MLVSCEVRKSCLICRSRTAGNSSQEAECCSEGETRNDLMQRIRRIVDLTGQTSSAELHVTFSRDLDHTFGHDVNNDIPVNGPSVVQH